jgi:hypothetical protein
VELVHLLHVSNSCSHPPRACHDHTLPALCTPPASSALPLSSVHAAVELRARYRWRAPVAGELRVADIHASSPSSAHTTAGKPHVSHICCKCFIRMLHMFHTYVASISSRCCICFAMATHIFSWRGTRSGAGPHVKQVHAYARARASAVGAGVRTLAPV